MKLNISYESLSKILDGKLTADNNSAVLNSLSIDSRTIQEGEGYLVIKGQKHDGHKFIKAAAEKGASIIIAEEGRGEDALKAGVALLEVKDTLKALQKLALHHRLKHNIKIAAVTGSNGKSTTKQMLLSICARAGKTCNTKGNFNNQIGVPLSILEINEDDKYGVFELGASHKGDIDEIASIVRPDVAIITNISPAHLEFFGDMETIYQTKTEIIKSINSYGTLIYNNDDAMLRRLKTEYDGRSLSFGFGEDSDIKIKGIAPFVFEYKEALFKSDITLERHNALNAAAACSGAIALGLFKDQIEKGISLYEPMPLRLEEHERNGSTFILDYYNANPASMANALEILARRAEKEGPAAAVLGDMLELGAQSARYHREIGEKIKALGIKEVYLAGKEMKAAYEVLQGGDVKAEYAENKEALIPVLKERCKKGGLILMKASRGLNFEDLYNNL